MKSSRYSPDQVAFGLRQAEEGTPVFRVMPHEGHKRADLLPLEEKVWRKKFQGVGVAEVRRLRILEEENRKLRQLVADLSLDKQMQQDVLRKSPEACSAEAPGRVPPDRLRRERAPGLRGVDPAPGRPPAAPRCTPRRTPPTSSCSPTPCRPSTRRPAR